MSPGHEETLLVEFVSGIFHKDHLIRRELESLLKAQRKLAALETAGVDNWEGYDFAMEEI